MAIVDILSSDNSHVGQGDFTAIANPPLYVAVNAVGAGGLIFSDANGNQYVEPGDNLLIQRLDLNIPYGFGQAVGTHKIGLAWKDSLNNFITIPELAGNSAMTVPDLCGVDFEGLAGGNGLYIAAPKNTTGLRYRLALTLITLNVSMIGLPEELEGLVIALQYHLRVLHTRAMQATVGP